MEENKNKRVLQLEIGDNVKKITITGEDKDQKVVMKQELNEDDMEQATGGVHKPIYAVKCPTKRK